MIEKNTVQTLNFSDDYIEAYVIHNADNFDIEDAIVVNLSATNMTTQAIVPAIVTPWKSTTLRGAKIVSGEKVGVFRMKKVTNLGGVIFRGWQWLGDRIKSFPRDTPLYISPQDSIGNVTVAPKCFTNEDPNSDQLTNFEVKLNVWWAPGHTDCFIHNHHPFLETHTQIFGTGKMQKFTDNDENTLYEEVIMPAGLSHDPFCRVAGENDWEYPWHRYYAQTDCIWLAVELHPVQ